MMYKFLYHNLASYHDKNFYYPTPIFKNGKWIPTEWITESDFEKSDKSCGKGLHLMKILNPKYGVYTGNCFEAEGKDLLGEDKDKARFKSIRLIRPISKDEIFVPKANLRYADLSYVDLSSANLRSADLRYANLYSADLSSANLYSANLRSADLYSADLSSANLYSARNINESLNLDKAYWNKFTQIDEEFKKLLSKERFVE